MKAVHLITVVDGVSTTSIPINEFVIYRDKIRPNYRQTVITRTLDDKAMVKIPDHITVYSMPYNLWELRRLICDILSDSKKRKEGVIFHLHHQKSALLFYIATLFMGLNKRTVFTVHSFYSNRDVRYKVSSCLCVLLCNYANCVSRAAFEDYPKWVKKIKGSRLRVVLNGIDCHRIDDALLAEDRHDGIRNLRTMVCVDRIIPIKNQKFIVGLMKYLPEMNLIFVGKEDKDKLIRRLASEEGVLDRITFTGLLPRDEVYRIINKCGLYVSASLVEGLHLSVLEAIRVGAIPLISDIPAHREIAAECNHLFDPIPLDVELWVKVIKNFMVKDKAALQSLSGQLSRTVECHFSLDKMHDEYDSIYKLMLLA